MKPTNIVITSLPRLEPWDYYYNDLCSQLKSDRAQLFLTRGNNFKIRDRDGTWDRLYQKFLEKTQELLGPLHIHANNKRDCWCYASNKDFYRSGIHNHMRTSIINAVYYFSIPTIDDERDSAISFYDDNKKEVWYYKPKECDLLIFPNYLKHQPLPTISEKYRISINLEIMCNMPEVFKRPTEL